ncbi:two-partner secretion domain-containing protein [Paraburkholderia youngii]|uniref:two-partner secretion domain-containing protein n=1 Tax=Paraburkholderia youngii TaxID=2782701 RepID=UPI00158FD6ED|nr:filamentous hemagglutinin N-terminal domain-containing protein [Paraburkholderia youngii]NUX59228.1 filamentous hemagglutinin N-terminal domain-containing protein [Paraburkholderia youngii]
MSHPGLLRPARRALRRQQSRGYVWLAVGVSLTGLSLTPVVFAAGVLPHGGTYVAGAGTIASQGNGLLITQPGSTRGVIDWNSFSIGRHNSVTFDNGSGATLNRVTGGTPSAILGSLSATGSLYVINPQGIVVGSSGVITTGGRFVASTLDICNDAFMRGSSTLTLSGNSNAAVINLGRISSSGGDVLLIARDAVINAGTLAAPDGTAELAAGGQVLLQDSASSRQVFVQTGSQGTVVNKGKITAAQVSLQAADGNVYALAGGGTRIRATGTASRDGHVWLVADSGGVEQLGKIAASNADGSGGTVDTQAAQLTFGRHAVVDASQWNLSTPTFTIDDVAAHALERSLNTGTSVDVTTTGANGATGDLGVASSLRWSGPASLTLAAYHDVSVATATTIANSGAGNLTLRADASGIDNGGSVINTGTIDWSRSTGIVSALHDLTGGYLPGNILSNSTWSAAPDSGLVTQVTVYALVNTVSDLGAVGFHPSGNYALGRDIDASPPPGEFSPTVASFSGQFDGMGHTISNLWLSESLFGDIGSSGVVRNLNIQGTANLPKSDAWAGFLADRNDGTIASVHSSGSVTSIGRLSTGGLVGLNFDGTITRSSSTADVSSDSATGGLVGTNSFGVIRQSFASGDVTSTHLQGAGGLVGYNFGVITESYATGTVHVQPQCDTVNACGGGLVGGTSGTISQSFATGKIDQPSGPAGGPGGIADYNANYIASSPGTITNDVYWDTQTTGAPVGVRTTILGANLGNAQGLTTMQMSTPSSFGPTYDFSPGGVWAMPAGATHPILQWQLAQ